MIVKTIKRYSLSNKESIKSDLKYWLSQPEEVRISTVEILRRQMYGSEQRLQRSDCFIQKIQR